MVYGLWPMACYLHRGDLLQQHRLVRRLVLPERRRGGGGRARGVQRGVSGVVVRFAAAWRGGERRLTRAHHAGGRRRRTSRSAAGPAAARRSSAAGLAAGPSRQAHGSTGPPAAASGREHWRAWLARTPGAPPRRCARPVDRSPRRTAQAPAQECRRIGPSRAACHSTPRVGRDRPRCAQRRGARQYDTVQDAGRVRSLPQGRAGALTWGLEVHPGEFVRGQTAASETGGRCRRGHSRLVRAGHCRCTRQVQLHGGGAGAGEHAQVAAHLDG